MANGYNLRRDELTPEDQEEMVRPSVRVVLLLTSKDLRYAVSRSTLRRYADELRGLANAIEFSAQNREERLALSVLRIKRTVKDLNGRNRKTAKADIRSVAPD